MAAALTAPTVRIPLTQREDPRKADLLKQIDERKKARAAARQAADSHLGQKPMPSKAPVSRRSSSQQTRTDPQGLNPVGVSRAKEWTPEVENAFRLQEAGFRGLEETAAFGVTIETWPESGFIRKCPTKHSIEQGRGRVLLYFRRTRECEPRYLNRVKLYRFA